MTTKTIKINNQELINLIESLYYEVNARKEIIAFMLNSNMKTDTIAFEEYNKEYMEFYIQYSEAKNKFEQEYIKSIVSNPISWTLNFSSCKVTIEYNE